MSRNGALIAVLLLVALPLLVLMRVALVSYRSTLVDFVPWPASAILRKPERAGVARLEAVKFKSKEGQQICGWYVPSRNRAAVIVAHGTNADRSSMLPELRALAAAGFGVLAFDWPGNGESEGQVKWGIGEQQALRAAVDWISLRADVDSEEIGALGFSAGGIIVAQVAAAEPRLHAIVLEATPTSFADYVYWERRQWGWFSEYPAKLALRRSGLRLDLPSPKDVVSSIAPRPLLVIGGELDVVVPPMMVESLYQYAQQPKDLWIVPGAMHGGYDRVQQAEYEKRITEFFKLRLQHHGLA